MGAARSGHIRFDGVCCREPVAGFSLDLAPPPERTDRVISTSSIMPRNLAPRYYVDPEVYRSERDAIFARHWQMLGPAAEVAEPGQYLAVEIANWKLFVLRG